MSDICEGIRRAGNHYRRAFGGPRRRSEALAGMKLAKYDQLLVCENSLATLIMLCMLRSFLFRGEHQNYSAGQIRFPLI